MPRTSPVKNLLRQLLDTAWTVKEDLHRAQTRWEFDVVRELNTAKVELLWLAYRLCPESFLVVVADDHVCGTYFSVRYLPDRMWFHVRRTDWPTDGRGVTTTRPPHAPAKGPGRTVFPQVAV